MPVRLDGSSIAFVTSKAYAALTASDLVAADALRQERAEVVPVVWDDPSVDWNRFDAIILRSTWDYHLHPARFISWIDSLERGGFPVWNPTNILRGNMDKRY